MTKVSDLVIQTLSNHGITTVFTVSGGGCIHLIDSLRTSSMTSICTHHEQTALMAAEGYTRIGNNSSDNMCASIVTTGPGGTNTITGLLGMWLDGIPSIVISGQVPSNQLSAGTGCRQIGDQEFNIVDTVRTMTKYATMITDPTMIIYEIEKALHIATSGRPGPVWIDMPLDIQGIHVDETACSRFEPDTVASTDVLYLDTIQELLATSTKPLIIAGSGVWSSVNGTTKLHEFLMSTGIPIVTGPHSGVDVVDNTYKYYGGRIGILGQLSSNHLVQEADLLICLGTRLGVKMTGYAQSLFSPNSRKIIVDIDENEILKHKFTVDVSVISDVADFLVNISLINYTSDISEWQHTVIERRSDQVYYQDKHVNLTDYASFYYLISKAPSIFGNTPIITSNGTAHVVTLQNYNINPGQRLFTNVGCASMGYGLPAAIGACIGTNTSPVICVEGDGSIMMNLQELQTLVGYNLPVKILLVNNDGYLSIKITQETMFNGNEFASGRNTGVTMPKFESIANAFGINYSSIRTNDEIESKLQWMMDEPGPCILEVFTHPYERHEPKVTHKGVGTDGKIIPGTLTDMTYLDHF